MKKNDRILNKALGDWKRGEKRKIIKYKAATSTSEARKSIHPRPVLTSIEVSLDDASKIGDHATESPDEGH